jgi:hypothetical protein
MRIRGKPNAIFLWDLCGAVPETTGLRDSRPGIHRRGGRSPRSRARGRVSFPIGPPLDESETGAPAGPTGTVATAPRRRLAA